MSVKKNGIYDFLKRLEIILEKSFPILPNYLVAVKLKEIETIIDSIYGSIPDEMTEARRILRRKEELQMEAQQKAEKIIADAQIEANRILSESELMRQVQKEAEIIKEQVIAECEEIKRRALEDAENYRNQAHDDAMRVKDGADAYAEQVLTGLTDNIAKVQQGVKDAQIYMEKLRAQSSDGYDLIKQNYADNVPVNNNSDDFKIQ